jgi:heptosyltransferase-2
MGLRVLIVNLDAMGDVLMTTAQLPALKRAHPVSHVTWLTRPAAVPLLEGNPLLDAVLAWNGEHRMILREQRFDLVLNADKSAAACAFCRGLRDGELRGFTLSDRGQIIPANPEASYNFRMGIDDRLKFRANRRTGQDILAETWKLPYGRDRYLLALSPDEQRFCEERRDAWDLRATTVVGLNTGCSALFPNKKMTVEQHVALLERLAGEERLRFLLLGGREDAERNAHIAARCAFLGDRLVATPTDEGLRRGICYEALADVVVTGDSLGMHIAIGLGKHVLAWFGLSCWTEIDFYDNGTAFHQADLDCSPCWKRQCPYNLECITGIDLDAIAAAVLRFHHNAG